MEFFRSSIHLGEVFVQLAAFIIVFLMLKAFAWKPILALLEKRRIQIRDEFEKIETAKKEIEALKSEYQTHLTHIDQEARLKLQEVISEGKRIAQEIQEEARQTSRETLDKAKEDIALEVSKARVTLRDEIVHLTISATEQLLEKKMDAKEDREIVIDFINKLGKEK